MEQPEDDYTQRIRKAVLYAIMRNSAVDIGNGQQGCEIQEVAVSAALTNIVAEFLAARLVAEGSTSKKDIRLMSEAVAKSIREQMQKSIDAGTTIPSYFETAGGQGDQSLN